jgi:hypothetical protein
MDLAAVHESILPADGARCERILARGRLGRDEYFWPGLMMRAAEIVGRVGLEARIQIRPQITPIDAD